MSIKVLVKTLVQIIADKRQSSKELQVLKPISFFEFTYDYFVNKYGLLNVAEKKIKEIFNNLLLSKKNLSKLELYARLLGISDKAYSTDDMEFLFILMAKFEKY